MSENPHVTWRVTWRITPLHPPRPRRHCGSCNATTAFVCSGSFRTNAQKKRLDVWLIYRCAICDGTWNLPILERCPVARIPPDQLQSFLRNDPAAATRHAFDLSRLARHSGQIDQDGAVTVEKEIDGGGRVDAGWLEIALMPTLPCRLRLESLLAQETGVARRALSAAYDAGALRLDPASRKGLRAPVRDGQLLRIDLPQARLRGIDPDKFWTTL